MSSIAVFLAGTHFSMAFQRVSSSQKRVSANSLPARMMFASFLKPASSAMAVAGMAHMRTPSISGMRWTSVESATTMPPSATLRSNLSRDGWFMATSTSGASTSGLPMGSSERHTLQLAVPPRISGP